MTYKPTKRIISLLVCIAMLLAYVPFAASAATALSERHVSLTVDPSTMDYWKQLFLPSDLTTENAGRVWMDKTVLADGSAFTGLTIREMVNGVETVRPVSINKDDPNSLLVVLSAMASNMAVTGMSSLPTDTMFVLDISGSMNDGDNDVAEELVEAANESIKALIASNKNNRIGVVLYSTEASVLLPLASYETAADGIYLNYTITGRNSTTETISVDPDVVYAGTTTKPADARREVVGGTYIQTGVMLAAQQFTAASNTVPAQGNDQRKPVIVLMSDGAPTYGDTDFTNPGSSDLGSGSGTSAALGFLNQLTASYAKTQIKAKYGTDCLFYTLGLGVGTDSVATSVLDPANSSVAINDFWASYNRAAVGGTVTVQRGGLFQSARYVTKISTALDQNYVDKYFEVDADSTDLAGDLKQAFKDIVGTIQLQSKYFPTLIAESEELSGYVSFVDRVGRYMEVTDVKGIMIHNTLFSGACLASNFVAGGGMLGTFDNPTALGTEMVAAVRARLGLSSDDDARTLIGLAYEYGQIRYTNASDFSNYIGWYANAAGEFLGFYQEGVTVLPAPTGNADTDPAFLVKSYGYLGEVDAEHGVSESDMMYATVQIRESIATGEQLVTFAIPAALIPIVTYHVNLNESGDLVDLTTSGAENPIRLVYEVALKDGINEYNVKQVVSQEYLAETNAAGDLANLNPDGSVNFYTNRWDHTNTTGYGNVNTYAYFNPSRQNEKYYYQADTIICTDTNGTPYTHGTDRPTGTMYRAYTVYTKTGNALTTETHYRRIDASLLATAKKTEGADTWYIPAGDVHVNLEGQTVYKGGLAQYDPAQNKTGTLHEASVPFVDTHNHSVNDLGYNYFVGASLGNNGKLTLTPETGIRITKTLDPGAAATTEKFAFVLTDMTNPNNNNTYAGQLVSGETWTDATVTFASGVATVYLAPGESLYIGGMTAGTVIRASETETADYLVTSVKVDGAAATTAPNLLVTANRITHAEFFNGNRGKGNLTIAKEVDHDFGAAYQIPADKKFTMEVTLQGIGVANATFRAQQTDSALSSITTNAEGRFTITLADSQQLELFDLPEGTVATVVEQAPGAGFAAQYWGNGQQGSNQAMVTAGTTVAVIVVNDYTPGPVDPVNITLTGNKTLTGRDWNDTDRFDFVLQRLVGENPNTGEAIWENRATAAATKANPSFNFNNAFANADYDTAGIYYYRVIELDGTIPGVTYDKTVHAFSVVVADNDMDGKLEIANIVAQRDTTHVTAPSGNNGWQVEVDFSNTYATTGSVTVTIDLNKRVLNPTGSALALPSGFIFGLYENGALAVQSQPTTDRGFARLVLNYTAAGKHTYTLKEIAPGTIPTGWQYSQQEITVTVEVTENTQTGLFEAVIYEGTTQPAGAGNAISATFTNTYDPADAELTVDFVQKRITGRDFLSTDNFQFLLEEIRVPQGTQPRVIAGVLEADTDNDRIANVKFAEKLTFDKVGVYYFQISEISADGNGVTADKTVYTLIVTVTDDAGTLKATYEVLNAAGNQITFVNTYKAKETALAISGTKTLEGRVLINDEFTFRLTVAKNAAGEIETGAKFWETHNEQGGIFTFPEITYTEAGTYYYLVEEILSSGSDYGIHFDESKFVVTVTVTDDTATGLLKASLSYTKGGQSIGGIAFLNKYIPAPVGAQIPGNKTLTGKVLGGGDFDFDLYASNAQWTQGDKLQTVENAADGTIAFSAVDYTNNNAAEFTAVGTYYYLIKEVNGGQTIDGVTYDDTVYRVRVEITDDLVGKLHASVHVFDDADVPRESVLFENVYAVSGTDSVVLEGNKTLENKTLVDGQFTFELYEADENYTVSGTPETTTNAGGKYKFTLEYTGADAGKNFYYVIKEANGGQTIDGITYSSAVYKIKVEVVDNGDGTIRTVVTKSAENLDFTNTYRNPNPPPQTGDVSQIGLWVAMMTLSGGGVLGTALLGRKKKEEEAE